jgi:hypothetical protein
VTVVKGPKIKMKKSSRLKEQDPIHPGIRIHAGPPGSNKEKPVLEWCA